MADLPDVFAALVEKRYEAMCASEAPMSRVSSAHVRIELALFEVSKNGGKADAKTLEQLVEVAALCIAAAHSVVLPAIPDAQIQALVRETRPMVVS